MQISLDAVEHACNEHLIKNVVQFKARANQFEYTAQKSNLAENTLKFRDQTKKMREDCKCEE